MKGGRPPMAPNRLSRKRAMQLCADKESPLDAPSVQLLCGLSL
jgi:hypothetical protein